MNDQNLKAHRKALEKIWNILQEIEEKKGITANGDNISIYQIHPSIIGNDREAEKVADERFNILRKLESEKAIKDLNWPYDHNKLVYLKLGDNYLDVFNKYGTEYEQSAQSYQQLQKEENSDPKDIIYEVRYSEQTREILVNNFLLAKPTSFGENEAVFAYLFKNPNRTISIKEIENENNTSLTKTLNKILENLGFIGDLRVVFFKLSKDEILFRNPIKREVLDAVGIKYLKLKKTSN